MQLDGIGLFLTKSREMAEDAYFLAQRIFVESGVLLLSVEPKADGSWVNHAYEYFKEKARDPKYVENQRLSAVDYCTHVVRERCEAAQKKTGSFLAQGCDHMSYAPANYSGAHGSKTYVCGRLHLSVLR